MINYLLRYLRYFLESRHDHSLQVVKNDTQILIDSNQEDFNNLIHKRKFDNKPKVQQCDITYQTTLYNESKL